MKKIEQFTNCYKVAKTLRFEAIPTQETLNNITKNKVLLEDSQKNEDYKLVKNLMDKRHKELINDVLSNIKFENLDEYFNLYQQKKKTDDEVKEFDNRKVDYENQISKAFESTDEFKVYFSQDMIKNILPDDAETKEEENALSDLNGFTSIFQNYYEIRRAIYTNVEKSGSIPYRIIEENLPRFMNNIKIFQKVRPVLSDEKIREIEVKILDDDYRVEDFFNIDFYNFTLTQKQIDLYNAIIGGISTKDEKVQGLNELINLYNQSVRNDPNKKVPRFSTLYKQILADTETMSFVLEQINNEEELLDAIKTITSEDYNISRSIHRLDKCIKNFSDYDYDRIYIVNNPKRSSLTSISHSIYNNFNIVKNRWFDEYDDNATAKQKEKASYEKDKEKAFKKVEVFTLNDMQKYGFDDIDFFDTLKTKFAKLVENYSCNFNKIMNLIDTIDTPDELKAGKNIDIIKNYLDSIKKVQRFLYPFVDGNNEADRDEMFYSELIENMDMLRNINAPYNKIRNYITKKPYTMDKFKLFFDNPSLLAGWDKNKEEQSRSILLRDNNKYYIAFFNSSKDVRSLEASVDGENYEKYVSRRLGEPHKMLPKVFFSKKGRDVYPRSKNIERIYEEKTFKNGKNFSKKDLHAFIGFYIDAMSKNPNYDIFNFSFKKPNEYENIGEFYNDVDKQASYNSFEEVSKEIVENIVKEGRAYLFQLYNKDFSDKSHGTPNLHTLYFLSLFNQSNTTRLAGGGEIFLRPKSLDINNVAVHKANEPIKNKNVNNPKKATTLPYDVYKDRRFTMDKYSVHIPIIINPLPENNTSNIKVREVLKANNDTYVIGIDRDENNLLYAVVMDNNGNIVEQTSLNIIPSDNDKVKAMVDYKTLISARQEEQKLSQQTWKQIETIKDLRNGYIGQAVHKVCTLIEKYDAVVAMEYLANDFKSTRREEKNVYKNFQVALCDKLRYMTFKNRDMNMPGSISNGYQLTNEKYIQDSMQNGFVFFVPGTHTDQIDPTTGFINLLYPRTRNIKLDDMKKYFSKFDSIRYDQDMNMFAFEFDYANFPKSEILSKTKWTVYTNGTRIKRVRNTTNNTFNYENFDLTLNLKHLFNKYNIAYQDSELLDKIINVDKLEFYKELANILRFTLQMKNIIPNSNVNYIISPVLNNDGKFFDSRNCKDTQPQSSTANGAYNIARKALWGIHNLKNAEDVAKASMIATKREWLEYAQKEA